MPLLLVTLPHFFISLPYKNVSCIISSRYTVSSNDAHFSVIVFSDSRSKAFLGIRFNDYFNSYNLQEAVRLLPYFGYQSDVAQAFNAANYEAFMKFNGKIMKDFSSIRVFIEFHKMNQTVIAEIALYR